MSISSNFLSVEFYLFLLVLFCHASWWIEMQYSILQYWLVISKVVLTSEALAADFTRERSLVGVRAFMYHQIVGLGELTMTRAANELLTMSARSQTIAIYTNKDRSNSVKRRIADRCRLSVVPLVKLSIGSNKFVCFRLLSVARKRPASLKFLFDLLKILAQFSVCFHNFTEKYCSYLA